ncbi:hypothetical protein [Natronorubrum texcoconense]|uniref:C2H2-type domain-containing protein n=1 Tax=Natronorubrum texcoconense TaxID=1095776 RepID=A0A1G9ABP5_9EURY|nr:hypothetical protein [Natronorubrum texcoconense]SDK23985.1 hypothetical protein SAMN04515672_2633 [Natronorubrum texcoconense]
MGSITTCPLCGADCEHRNHVRSHMHEHHRKSEIIDEYLGAIEN